VTAALSVWSDIEVAGGASAEELAAVVVVLSAYARPARRPTPDARASARWRRSRAASLRYRSPRDWDASA
jgi:hypothetical protein